MTILELYSCQFNYYKTVKHTKKKVIEFKMFDVFFPTASVACISCFYKYIFSELSLRYVQENL